MRNIFLLIFILFFTGCTSTKQYINKPITELLEIDKSRIIINRTNSFGGSADTLLVYDHNILIGELNIGGTLKWDRPPGKVSLSIKSKLWGSQDRVVEYNCLANKQYDFTLDYQSGLTINTDNPYETLGVASPVNVSQTGTGFLISNDGYIITNAHVVDGMKNILVNYNHENSSAELIAIDKINDLAIIKLNRNTNFIPINFDLPKKGDNIVALGYPLISITGNEIKATFGNINSLTGVQNDLRLFQIDAPIQPGNSGGPLLNDKGEIIGIVTSSVNQKAIFEQTGTLHQNINYAIKIAYAKPLLEQYKINYKTSNESKILPNSKIIEKVESSVVLINASK